MKKKKAKNQYKKRLILAMITFACIFGCFSVGNIYARYTDATTGTTTARVATFSFDISSSNSVSSSSVTLNLFDTNYVNGNVKSDSNESQVVAPGTYGYADFQLINKGEVALQFSSLNITEVNSGSVPIEYAWTLNSESIPTDDSNWYSATDIQDVITASSFYTRVIAPGSTVYSETYRLWWRWKDALETDSYDTSLGVVGSATVTTTIELSVQQYVAPTRSRPSN